MEEFKITQGYQREEGKCLQMTSINHLFHSHVQRPYSTFFFLRSIAALIFVAIHVLLELKVGRFLQMHVYLITVLFGMYPVWIPRWIQITSIQTLFKIWFCLRPHDANKCLHKTTFKQSWSWGPVSPQPHLWPAVPFSSSSGIQKPSLHPTLNRDYSHASVHWKGGHLHHNRGDLRLSLTATHWASVRFLALCCLFRTFFFPLKWQ